MVRDGVAYYSSGEVAAKLSVHRLTLLRWIKEGKVPEVRRDRLGRRLFTEGDIDLIKKLAFEVTPPALPASQLLLPLPQRKPRGVSRPLGRRSKRR